MGGMRSLFKRYRHNGRHRLETLAYLGSDLIRPIPYGATR